jgi:hypothetical protein
MVAKESKHSVDYTAHAKNHAKRCALCRHFLPAQSQCRRVAGAISPSGWCKLFTKRQPLKEDTVMDKFMNRSSKHDDYEALRARDAQARQEKMYPSSEKMRDFAPKASPEAIMAARHSNERGAQQDRHHRATQALLAQQQSARNRRLQTSHPLPADDAKMAQEFDELNAKNRREREELNYRQLVEKDRMRSVK